MSSSTEISFMERLKKGGVRIEPWGVPDVRETLLNNPGLENNTIEEFYI